MLEAVARHPVVGGVKHRVVRRLEQLGHGIQANDRAQVHRQRAIAIQADTPELALDAEFTALAHLLSAGSLHRLQDRSRRDEHLQRAIELSQLTRKPRATEEGARLLAAECALEDRDAGRALRDLAELPPGVARRTQALRLKLQATRLARQPMEALKTARLLAKHQGFTAGAAEGLLRSLASEALGAARMRPGKGWKDLARAAVRG